MQYVVGQATCASCGGHHMVLGEITHITGKRVRCADCRRKAETVPVLFDGALWPEVAQLVRYYDAALAVGIKKPADIEETCLTH